MAEVVVSELPLITQATLDDVFIINDGNDTTSSITWANMLASIQQLQGQVLFDSGSETLPSISFVMTSTLVSTVQTWTRLQS